jgi:glycosyltransferase involved in cell wall biosynthesis
VAGGRRPQFTAEAGLDGLTLLGHVPDEQLPGLYAGAEAFVLPSLYEGFGLPVLEAMASGTPVLASNNSALPETCGQAARLVEANEWTAAIEELLADPAEQQRLRQAGLERAAALTWGRTARAVDARGRPQPAPGAATPGGAGSAAAAREPAR